MAGMPGSGGVAHRTPFDIPTKRALAAWLLAPAVAAALLGAWLLAAPQTPDLAGQAYRASLFGQFGFQIWDAHWYAGHHLIGYSVLAPPLAWAIGLRLTACLAVLASAALFQRVAATVYGPSTRWAAAAFALAAAGDAWIGRVTFALGVTFALAAVLALLRDRPLGAALLAALCTAASPVAGVLLALAGASHAVVLRRPRSALILAAPSLGVAAALAALFPEGGTEPYPLLSSLATLAVAGCFLLALAPEQRLLRRGALIYALAVAVCVVVPTPMGSNVERYAVLLAGPLLLCAWAARSTGPAVPRPTPRPLAALMALRSRHATSVLAAALLVWAVWVAWGPVRETAAVAGNESTSASYYAPVEHFLATRTTGPVRIEVPFTRSHWEAARLAPAVSLARGWEKQLDQRYDGVLLRAGLSAASYERWLREQAVSYVALPDTPLDPSSAGEGRLIGRGLPYLREVFTSSHWRIYAVQDAQPLLSGPGRLASLGHEEIALEAYAPARLQLRVHFSRYLAVTRGRGCVARAGDGWTSVLARAPGRLVLQARFSLGRALGLTPSCHA
jgi:hypothetical protein